MKNLRWSIISILAAFACVDPVDLKISNTANNLVVDGIITDQPGPYFVKLARSLPFDNTTQQASYTVPETMASVVIHDQTGLVIQLTESKPGVYQTPLSFQGQRGASYSVHITLQDGSTYESTSETIGVAPVLDSIHYNYLVYQRLQKNSQGAFVEVNATGFTLTAEVNDPGDTDNYYRWELSGIFEFFSINDDPTKKQCWAPVDRLETTILVASDEFRNGQKFQEDLTILPYDRQTYYLVTVNQYSLTRSAFEFWKGFRNQQLNTGSIFDPAPAAIVGNIHSNQNPEEKVLGYFGASAVFQKKVLINRWRASNLVSPTPYKEPIPGDCRLQEPNATNIKPPGFL